jgi:hypothetical protein
MDATSGESRAMVSVGAYRFAFRHDSMEPRTSPDLAELLLKFPKLEPVLDGFCTERRDFKLMRPDLVELSLLRSPRGSARIRTRAEIWRETLRPAAPRFAYPEMGLESRKFIDDGGHELFIPTDDHARAPSGELLAIRCRKPLNIGAREFEHYLGCGFSYRFQPQIVATVEFHRELLPHWRRILVESVALLDDAYRPPSPPAPARPSARSE